MLTSSNILIKRLNEIRDFIGQARVDMALERMSSIITDYTPIEDNDPFSLYLNPFYKKWDKKITELQYLYADIQEQFMNNFITPDQRDVRMRKLIASLLEEREFLVEEFSYRMRKNAA